MSVYYDEFCVDCTDCWNIQVHTTKTGRDCKVSFPCCNIIFSLLFCFNVFIDCSGDFDLDVVFFSTCCLLIGHQFLMLSSFQMWQDIGTNYGHNYCRKILFTHTSTKCYYIHMNRGTQAHNANRCTYINKSTQRQMSTWTEKHSHNKCILSIILLKTQLQNSIPKCILNFTVLFPQEPC